MMNTAIRVGRFAAWCTHPLAAWRVGSARARGAIVIGYAGAAYVVTFLTLWLRAS